MSSEPKSEQSRTVIIEALAFRPRQWLEATKGRFVLLWSRTEDIRHALRDKLSFSGWLGVTISLTTGIVALRYAYQSQLLAYKSMKLAEWTARKDFLEFCQDTNSLTANRTVDCERALQQTFPEPPYVQFGAPDRLERRMMDDLCGFLDQERLRSQVDIQVPMDNKPKAAESANWAILTILTILGFCFMILHHRRKLHRLLNQIFSHQERPKLRHRFQPYRHHCDTISRPPELVQTKHEAQISTVYETPASVDGLRRRNAGSSLTWHLDLRSAAEQGLVRKIKYCLACGVHVDAVDPFGSTALIISSMHGRVASVMYLLSKGANINFEGGVHGNALQSASRNGHEKVVKTLLEHGANLRIYSQGSLSALHIACREGNLSTVQTLIDFGADVNYCREKELTALQLAAQEGHALVVKLLLQHGAQSSIEDTSVLEIAARKGFETIVKFILNPEINARALSERLGSSLLAAAERNHESIVDYLLNQDRHIQAPEEDLVQLLISAAESGFQKIVKALLQFGVNKNGYRLGRCAIEVAAGTGQTEIVSVLLAHGARVDPPYGYQGALEAAARGGYKELVIYLLRRGADVNARDCDHQSALSSASLNGHEPIVKMLLDCKADPNAQGDCCGNALKAAVRGGHSSIVELLLVHGADVNAECVFCGNTLHKAVAKGNDTIIQLLLDDGAEISPKEPYLSNPIRGYSLGHLKKDAVPLARTTYGSLGRCLPVQFNTARNLIDIEEDNSSKPSMEESLILDDGSCSDDSLFHMEL